MRSTEMTATEERMAHDRMLIRIYQKGLSSKKKLELGAGQFSSANIQTLNEAVRRGQEAARELTQIHAGFIAGKAKRYQCREASYQDLFQEGSCALLRVAAKFKMQLENGMERQNGLLALAASHIILAMLELVNEHRGDIRVPLFLLKRKKGTMNSLRIRR